MKKTIFVFVIALVFAPVVLFSKPLRFSSFGVQVGQVRPSIVQQNAASIGLHAYLRQDDPKLVFKPFVEYWSISYTQKNEQKWDRQLFAAGVSALRPFSLTNSKAEPYIGGGAGLTLNLSRTSANSPEVPPSKKSEFDLALHAVAGINVSLSQHMNGLIELKYTLAGLVDYFGFFIGLSYQFNANLIQSPSPAR